MRAWRLETKSSSITMVESGARPIVICDAPSGITVPANAPSTIERTGPAVLFLAARAGLGCLGGLACLGAGAGRRDGAPTAAGLASRGCNKSRRKINTVAMTNSHRPAKNANRTRVRPSSVTCVSPAPIHEGRLTHRDGAAIHEGGLRDPTAVDAKAVGGLQITDDGR